MLKCDTCYQTVTAQNGMLHALEDFDNIHGFAFFRWNESAAQSGHYGHVHKHDDCMQVQLRKYLAQFRVGRIEYLTGSKIIKRKVERNEETA